MRFFCSIICILVVLGCGNSEEVDPKITPDPSLIVGADLSYLNEMVDCGAQFKSESEVVEPYEFFANKGCQMVRLRLWHTPTFNRYSGLDDVLHAAKEVTNRGMDVLLDFHYSDSWADPSKQIIPNAWRDLESDEVLSDSVFQYTQMVLSNLLAEGIVPTIVQVGNEINSEVLKSEEVQEGDKINWERNTLLLNSGLNAVVDFNQSNSQSIGTMLHIAQPENVSWWFKEAEENGIANYDWIGLSYYPQWSKVSISELGAELSSIKNQFNKKIMIVETAYPHSLQDVDQANNILGRDASLTEYGISPAGQLQFLNDLKEVVLAGGGDGIIYWEPAWVSTPCKTLWGTGSHWENATFFSTENVEALEAFSFFGAE
ncbi:MAG: glycosyl hydrolase 53 family protein [Ekhidna sp.]|nr:glycosyl hydrolase 53 family protein [Ekhidna sp.]